MRHALSLLLLLVWSALPTAFAQTADLNDAQLERYHELNAELRCVICQNRSIAESDAPLAKDLRGIVARQLAEGRSDDEIKAYLVERYGEWVLYDPPFSWSTWVLWLGPFVLLFVGLVFVIAVMRGRYRAPEPRPPLDRERLARVLKSHEAGPDDTDKDRS
ncbi:cytochrome c-type biogenesis protein [Salinisphaera orenii]|uniref:Cytochrome c-type biogenesis protein n=1 Tax=Salinisphaera orenii YIM 95161 TaxID=1051139 RepID=A0A423PM63_9GAMM|nr:cytochrome c-type biogenesis protein [Salinisphaera halophila]ROO26700.1 cytochrome C biogenesis protein [Salinisphaera halophila YIM 95161]